MQHRTRKPDATIASIAAQEAREGDELYNAHVRRTGERRRDPRLDWWRIRSVRTSGDRTVIHLWAGWETWKSPTEGIVVRRSRLR